MASTQSADVHFKQFIDVDPHADYLFSGWVKTSEVAIAQSGGEFGANLSVFTQGLKRNSRSVEGTTDWTYLSVVINSGELERIILGPRLGYTSSMCRGTAWFDDLTFIRISPEEAASEICHSPDFLTPDRKRANLLRNPGFEAPFSILCGRQMERLEIAAHPTG